jgi:hypothetical protein
LFGFREGNSNRNHYGGNHEVQERGNIMSWINLNLLGFSIVADDGQSLS